MIFVLKAYPKKFAETLASLKCFNFTNFKDHWQKISQFYSIFVSIWKRKSCITFLFMWNSFVLEEILDLLKACEIPRYCSYVSALYQNNKANIQTNIVLQIMWQSLKKNQLTVQ